ncbi:MAG: hypothetical protein E7616_05425 [Ruminococcaceae bacterium]|nr:hypothetical protein [Oscillospiraceae bacterium]
MKKHLTILLTIILCLAFLVSCKKEDNGKKEFVPTIDAPPEGITQEEDRELLAVEQIEKIKEGMHAAEVYEQLGNPHLVDNGVPISSRMLRYAYYQLSDGRVMKIEYVGGLAAQTNSLRRTWQVDAIEYLSLDEFEKVKQAQ